VAATIPASETYDAADPLTPRKAAGVIRDAADQPALRWFVPATVCLVALSWSVGVFIQPVSASLLTGAGVASGRVPTLLGVLYAGFTAASTVVTYKSGAIREYVGIERWTRLAPVGLGAVYVASFLFPVLAVPAFFARRMVLSATSVFRDTYVNEHAETVGRATVLSAVAMLLGLARIPVRVGVGVVADASTALAAIGTIGLLLLALGVTLAIYPRVTAESATSTTD
jgi:hypothetical protein